MGGKLVLFVKGERLVPEMKNIFWLKADSPTGPFGAISAPIAGNWVEGPTAIDLDGETIVFFDQYQLGKDGAVATRDVQNWSDATSRLSIPNDASHGSIISINRSTYCT